MKAARDVCRGCGTRQTLRKDGCVVAHPHGRQERCIGSGMPPGTAEESWETRARIAERLIEAIESLPTCNGWVSATAIADVLAVKDQ